MRGHLRSRVVAIRNKFKLQTIRRSLIYSQITVLLLLTFSLGFGIYTFTCEILKTKNREAHQRILQAAEVIMDDQLEHYRNVSRLILENSSIQDVLSDSRKKRGPFMTNQSSAELDQELSSYANGVEGVASLYIFDNQGKLYYLDYEISSMKAQTIADYDKIMKEQWYQEAEQAKGAEVFFGYNVLRREDDSFSCVKVLNKLNTNEKKGILILNINKKVLGTVFRSFEWENDMYGIFYESRRDQELVYQTSPGSHSGKVDLNNLQEGDYSGYEITNHTCKMSNWSMKHIVKKENVFREAGQIRLLIILMGIGATLIMTIITIRQVLHITDPLYQLREDIRLVAEGTYQFDHSYKADEVGIIGQEFQRMVTEGIALKERVQQEEIRRQASELELLQSQINPHFLYNTLDTLYWIAIVEDQEKIAELTRALSDIFRISLNKGKELISIRGEIAFIEDYLLIQNTRFDGKFITQINIPEEIRDLRIIKLIIQPFVENAIYHGLEPKLQPGNLCLSGRITGTNLILFVEDDGVGMETSKDMGKGYAIQNVIERIRLHYGQDADVKIDSEPGRGTRVTISLPMEKVEEETRLEDIGQE